jgi:hypothetical protein
MTAYILPTKDAALRLHDSCQMVAARRSNPIVTHVPDQQTCRAMVADFMDVLVNAQLLWLRRTDTALDDIVGKYFPLYVEMERAMVQSGYSRQRAQEFARDFYDYVIDPVFEQLQQLVHVIIPERTWDIWLTKPLGADIILEKGPDYRIADWTRRKERGEFRDE